MTDSGPDWKVGRENTFVLSEDGQSITETDVTPPPMALTIRQSWISFLHSEAVGIKNR